MIFKKWEDLPEDMQTEEVRQYYDLLKKKKISLIFKRIFDVIISLTMIIVLSPVFLILAAAIKLDSKGPVFYRQVRLTQYGKEFRIHKFRSMVTGADKGSQVTVKGDKRITRVGSIIRKYRLDEIGQLIDVLQGNMTFVGVRPEVPKYVKSYTNEMKATFLLPAGVTNLTCIYYIDEAMLLDEMQGQDIDYVYVKKIMPNKMEVNLQGIRDFSFLNDIKIMFMTLFAVLGKEKKWEKK